MLLTQDSAVEFSTVVDRLEEFFVEHPSEAKSHYSAAEGEFVVATVFNQGVNHCRTKDFTQADRWMARAFYFLDILQPAPFVAKAPSMKASHDFVKKKLASQASTAVVGSSSMQPATD